MIRSLALVLLLFTTGAALARDNRTPAPSTLRGDAFGEHTANDLDRLLNTLAEKERRGEIDPDESTNLYLQAWEKASPEVRKKHNDILERQMAPSPLPKMKK
jgi:hypothetical protein